MLEPVVIESPYGGDEETVARNLTYLRRAMADCFTRGEAPYASHGLYTQPGVLLDSDPEQRRLGIQAGFVWAELALTRVVYMDYGVTSGMEEGIAHALTVPGQVIDYRRIGENP